MKRLTLIRFSSSDMGTFGRLGKWFTVELPWKDNEPRTSCIPTGEYVCKRDYYHKGGYPAFEVQDVPGRSEIKIHVANTKKDVLGCIGPGLSLGVLGSELAVLSSKIAFGQFMDSLEGVDEFVLNIMNIEDLT